MHTVAVCYNCSRAVCGVPAPYVVRRRRSGPLKSAPPAQSAPAAGAEYAGAGAKVRRRRREERRVTSEPV